MSITVEVRSTIDSFPPVGSIQWVGDGDLSGIIVPTNLGPTNGFGGPTYGVWVQPRAALSPVDRTMDFALSRYENLLRRLAD